MESNDVQISVIMSVYNEKKEWIIEAVESVINQTYSNFELIILLDNPEDDSLIELLSKFEKKDSRIKILLNEKNIGLARSLNKALAFSKGKFIARMDADDICENNRFEEQINYLTKYPTVSLIGTNIKFIDENSKSISRTQQILTSNDSIKKNIQYRNVFHHPTWMFRKEILTKIQGYRPFPYSQDYDFVCRCIASGIVCSNINQELLKYRIRSNSISVKKKYQQSLIVEYIQKNYRKEKKYKKDFFSEKKIIELLEKADKSKHLFIKSEEYYEFSKKNLEKGKIINSIFYFLKSFKLLPTYRFGRLKNSVMIFLLKITN